MRNVPAISELLHLEFIHTNAYTNLGRAVIQWERSNFSKAVPVIPTGSRYSALQLLSNIAAEQVPLPLPSEGRTARTSTIDSKSPHAAPSSELTVVGGLSPDLDDMPTLVRPSEISSLLSGPDTPTRSDIPVPHWRNPRDLVNFGPTPWPVPIYTPSSLPSSHGPTSTTFGSIPPRVSVVGGSVAKLPPSISQVTKPDLSGILRGGSFPEGDGLVTDTKPARISPYGEAGIVRGMQGPGSLASTPTVSAMGGTKATIGTAQKSRKKKHSEKPAASKRRKPDVEVSAPGEPKARPKKKSPLDHQHRAMSTLYDFSSGARIGRTVLCKVAGEIGVTTMSQNPITGIIRARFKIPLLETPGVNYLKDSSKTGHFIYEIDPKLAQVHLK